MSQENEDIVIGGGIEESLQNDMIEQKDQIIEQKNKELIEVKEEAEGLKKQLEGLRSEIQIRKDVEYDQWKTDARRFLGAEQVAVIISVADQLVLLG